MGNVKQFAVVLGIIMTSFKSLMGNVKFNIEAQEIDKMLEGFKSLMGNVKQVECDERKKEKGDVFQISNG